MGVQKSRKGRQTAALQIQEIGRRVTQAPKNRYPGRQQFGGVGSVPALDQDVDHLSHRARRAIEGIVGRST